MRLGRFIRYTFFLIVVCNSFLSTPVCSAQTSTPSPVNVRLVTDEAEAVLVILNKRKANQPITEADWQKVFQSEGYIRLKKRETAMKNSFEDADFKTFALSDSLAERAQALEETLEQMETRRHNGCSSFSVGLSAERGAN